MFLKLFVDSKDETLKNKYLTAAENHNNKLLNNSNFIDAGFDLFAPGNEGAKLESIGDDEELRFYGPNWKYENPVNKVDLNVICSAKMYLDSGKSFNTGYYMYPRSSLSKTQLRLANSTGIIDAGYRGHLMGMFDVVNIPEHVSDDRECDYYGEKFDRYLQICAPGLVPIVVEIVESKEDLGEKTERGDGGFGSSGR
jgi:dUTPase